MTLFQHVKTQWISDLKSGQAVEAPFRVVQISRRHKKDGSLFLALTLMDRTGKMDAKVWDHVEKVEKAITAGEIFTVSGTVHEYHGRREIHIRNVQKISDNMDVDGKDFSENAAFDVDARFDAMIAFVSQRLKNPELNHLLEAFSLNHGEAFSRHYGAQKIHHARIGGLLEHTDSMVRLAAMVADHYELDSDIMLMGALLHDLGKLREFCAEPAIQATFQGGLLGHIVISLEMFNDLCRRVPGIPEEIRLHLQHLIVSHHGEREFGSPEVPKTREAMALHAIDLLDSKLAIFLEASRHAIPDQGFSDYIPAISRRILIQNPAEGDD